MFRLQSVAHTSKIQKSSKSSHCSDSGIMDFLYTICTLKEKETDEGFLYWSADMYYQLQVLRLYLVQLLPQTLHASCSYLFIMTMDQHTTLIWSFHTTVCKGILNGFWARFQLDCQGLWEKKKIRTHTSWGYWNQCISVLLKIHHSVIISLQYLVWPLYHIHAFPSFAYH